MKEMKALVSEELQRLQETKTFKKETPLSSPQRNVVKVNGRDVIMLASNNYLGLSDHPKIKEAAVEGIRKYGYGMSSVRFICGTQTIHRELEEKVAHFVGAEDSILFLSCFSANEGLFPSFTNEKLSFDEYRDVIYSDRLNHASIIDGARLCRPEVTDRKIFAHRDVDDLARQLEEDRGKDYRFRIVATDGVFSMEGDLAPLPELVQLCRKNGAVLVVDDSHALGVLGRRGRGTAEELGVFGEVDIQTGTLGKAMGGAAGGYIAASKEIVTYLRQKSRPYTFSNSLPPMIVYAAIAAFDLLEKDTSLVEKLRENTAYFRKQIKGLGFKIIDGVHPIVPIMLGEAALAMDMSDALLEEGVYIKGLWFPVVPKGEARLRAQISAALERTDLDRALEAFERVGRRFGVI